MRKCGRNEEGHLVYAYRLTIAARFLAQSIILFPCCLLLLSLGFVAYIVLRNYVSGAVDWRVAVIMIGLLGVGLFIANLCLAELPFSFKVYDVEGRLKVKRGKERFYVTEILDDYAVRMRTKFNKQSIAGLMCYCLKIKTNRGVRIMSFLSVAEKTKFKSILVKYDGMSGLSPTTSAGRRNEKSPEAKEFTCLRRTRRIVWLRPEKASR